MTKISEHIFSPALRKETELMDFLEDVRKSINNTMSAQVAKAEYTNQAADIASTTLYTPTTAWFFRVSVYMICTVAGSAGTLSCTIAWTDAVGAKTVKPASDLSLTTTTGGSTGTSFIVSNASAITFSTTITGGAGSPEYNLYIIVEQIG